MDVLFGGGGGGIGEAGCGWVGGSVLVGIVVFDVV